MFKEIYIHQFEKDGRRATLAERLQMRKTCGPYRWTPAEPSKGRGFYQSSKGLRVGDSSFELRLEKANDYYDSHITGYFTDDFCDQTMEPIIARLPKSRGFLAGWTMGPGMCASLESYIYDDIEDAARGAHQMAEFDAEKEREYQEEERMRLDMEEEEEEEEEEI